MLERIFAPASVDSLFSDAAMLAAMARFERGLAQAQASIGLVPDSAAQAHNAAETGRASLNWEKAEEILYREYSALLPGLREPGHDKHVRLARAPAVGQ